MRIWLLAMMALVLLTGCAVIEGELPKHHDHHKTDHLRAGAAKVDITPPPGFPMGGHSFIANTSRGQWLRLKARSLYIEAADGTRLALVSADLWSMPAGMADRVMDMVGHQAGEGCRLGRDQVIFAATHTHQSPGNFSSASLYNTGASNAPGFDHALFDFLAGRLSKVIIASCRQAEDAYLFYHQTRVDQLARNRSYGAFLKNPESKDIIAEGQDLHVPAGTLPSEYPVGAYKAVDPTLRTIWLESVAQPAHIIGVGAFVAVHPTALSHKVEVYSSDLFGAAAIMAEHQLRAFAGRNNPVVAIFNGPEGDVSPDWLYQDRQDVLTLGKILGNAIIRSGRMHEAINPFPTIQIAFASKTLSDQMTSTGQATLSHAKGGPALLAGAEDGPVNGACREGDAIHPVAYSDAKKPSWKCKAEYFVANLLQQYVLSTPEEVPLGIYKLGPIVFATLPGEFTTVMGRRVSNVVAGHFSADTHIILVGLSNEYVSYFTTPEEYAEQHYEGGMTLYGAASGTLIGDYLGQMARFRNISVQKGDHYHYTAGMQWHFGPARLSKLDAEELKDHLKERMFHEGRGEQESMARFCWIGPAPSFEEANRRGWDLLPRVRIESRQVDGSWQTLKHDFIPETDEGLNMVVQLSRADGLKSEWCVFWMFSEENAGKMLRFNISNPDGTHIIAELKQHGTL